jgi:hypothetical protein
MRNKEKQAIKTFDLDMAEITSSKSGSKGCTWAGILNPCPNAALDMQSDKRVNNKQISPIQEVLHWPNTPKRQFKRTTCQLSYYN